MSLSVAYLPVEHRDARALAFLFTNPLRGRPPAVKPIAHRQTRLSQLAQQNHCILHLPETDCCLQVRLRDHILLLVEFLGFAIYDLSVHTRKVDGKAGRSEQKKQIARMKRAWGEHEPWKWFEEVTVVKLV